MGIYRKINKTVKKPINSQCLHTSFIKKLLKYAKKTATILNYFECYFIFA